MPNKLREVAGRVRVGAYDGVNTTVVAGSAGLLVVDPAGAELAEELTGPVVTGPVVAVALTHGHAPHAAGLPALRERWPGLVVHAHEDAGVPVDRPFSSVGFVDLGDRVVELLHPGRGHSAGDAAVRVPDVDVVAAGDLVGGDGVPRYGGDCFPLAWPAAYDVVVGLLTERTVLVPGHGPLMGKAAVEEQRQGVAVVAQTIADAAAPGVAAEELLAAHAWPFPSDQVATAVARALVQLPRSARRLPLA